MAINKTTQYTTNPNTIPVDTSTGSQTIVQALDQRVMNVSSIADLQSLTPSAEQIAHLSQNNESGTFVFKSGDKSSEVSLDSYQSYWIPPASDLTGANGAWKRGVDNANRLNLSTARPGIERVELQSVAASTSYTIANLNGPGVIDRIWMALGNPSSGDPLDSAIFFDGEINIYYDGEVTPSFTVTLANLSSSAFIAADVADPGNVRYASNSVEFEHGDENLFGFTFAIDIPYNQSVIVEYNNPSSRTGILFSQVFYKKGKPANYRLKSVDVSYINRDTVLTGSTYNLLTVPQGVSGWLVYSSIFGDGVSNRSWLERDVEITFDQEASPDFRTTGLEDWFLGSFYFQDRAGYGSPHTVVGANNVTNHYTHAGINLLTAYNGIRFENGVSVDLGTEGAETTDFEIAHCQLYYEEV